MGVQVSKLILFEKKFALGFQKQVFIYEFFLNALYTKS